MADNISITRKHLRNSAQIRSAGERWPRGFVAASKAGRVPEISEGLLLRAIRRGTVPALRIHGRWFVSAQTLASLFGFGVSVDMAPRRSDVPGGGDAA